MPHRRILRYFFFLPDKATSRKQLRQQITLLDRCAEEAISMEERSIAEQDLGEGTIAFEGPYEGITLSTSTWGAFEDFTLDYWLGPNVAVPGWPAQIPSASAGSS